MSTVEEAASLFGAPDSANDPFASTLAENTESSDTNIHAGNELFSGQNYDSTSDVFDTTASNGTGSYNSVVHTNETTNHVNANTWNTTSYDYPSGSGLTNGSSFHGTQAYGSVTDAKHNEYPSYEPARSTYAANGSHYSSTQYTNGYDASQYSYNASSSIYSPPAQNQVPTAYDPYVPSQTASVSNSQTVYDPYKPSQAYVPQQAQPAVNTSYAPSPPSVEPKSKSSFTAEVPPPLPSASAYRPKASNAYDPPLPPPKPRRTSGWQVPTSPGVTASYPLPNTVVQPILSPPPPPRSVSRQHTQPTVPHPYAPIPEPERHNTLPPHISTQSANGYAPETQWSQASSHSLGQSGYAPPAQSAPSQYSPSTTPAVAVVPATGWANLDHTVSQVMDDSPYQPGPIEPTLEDISQVVDTEIPGDEFSRAYGESLEANQSEPTQIIPSNVDTKSPSPHAQTYHPVGNGHSSNPSSRQQSPVRAKSPGSTSIRSWGSGKRQSVIASPPPPQAHDYSHPPAARSMYDPPVIPPSQRTASPSVMSVRSIASVNAYDSYGSSNGLDSLANRDRSMSNASLLSVSSSVHDPYAPSLHSQSRQQSVDDTIHGTAFHPGSSDHSFASASYGSQVLSTGPRPTHTPYAPSPSLSGTNDPLGRTSARIPVFSFGFGGRIVTCFHGSSSLNTGFDVALSSRPSTDVHFRVLNKVIPESALNPSAAQFPGPLFSDPGTPSTSIIGSGAAAQTKAKKARVIKYLEERAEEISQSIGYLQQGNTESQNAQAKHVLVKLLKVMVEHDGRLSGSPEIDSAVRAALVPYIANADISTDGLKTAASIGFSRVGDSHPGDLASPPYPGLPSISQDTTGDPPIAVNTLRATNLDRIQELLIRGERQAAYQYAADEKLWAHAMVIASSIGKEAWKNIVSEFVRTELTSAPTIAGLPKPSALDGREPLKVAYSLFAGQGAAAVQELLPPKPLVNSAPPPAQTLQSLQVLSPPAFLAGPGFTPMTPNFPQSVQAAPIPPSILSKWTETAAMMISSPMTNETSSALTSLGDQLAANGWVEAAHCCYLLSPQTSPFGGIGVPACRVHLLGASPGTTPSFWKDPDTIVLSEIVEFALSLVPSVKGQEPFHGLPHLQAYRLIRAMALAELGYDQQSNRYCEAITQSISRSSPYIHTTLVEQLKGLSDRLIAAPHVDKSGSWIGSKMAKPSLDKLGNWLEGRFTSFIAGDTDSPLAEDSRGNERTFGAFTHYSTISSTTTSAMGSPHLSTTDLTEIPPTPPYRTGSAMALRSSAGQQVPINRASSAMDYIRRKASPVPRTSSANALTTSIPNTPSFPPHSYGTNGVTPKANGPSGNRLAEITPQELSPTTPSQTNGGWWGATESSVPTPTAASFVTTNVPVVESTDGFISLMDDPALSLAPSPAPSSFNRTFSSSTDVDFDDDDLGLSTNKSRKPAPSIEKVDSQQSSSSSSSTVEERKGEPAKTEDKSEPKQTSSGGWLSRIWGGGAAKSDKPAPIKANLGEQTSFYYDKELKRWVNKGAAPEPTKATPPPPPPRAQTASPGTAGARLPGLSPAPPIARPSTTVDLSEPPRKPPMRIRSNLVPPETASAPTTPASSTMSPMNGPPTPGLNGPPSARLKAQAKRSVRSRYVDVFQQPGAA